MLLAGRTAVITGAAAPRGIGRATARLFAEHGARTALLDIDGEGAGAAAAGIGPEHRGYRCDVRDKAACEETAARIIAEFGGVDILVNNAGASRPHRIMDIRPADYDEVMDLNLRGTVYMSQAFVPHFRGRGSGAIVCMSSVAGQRGGGIFGGAHYAASKAGILGFVRALGRELAPEGIRVNAVSPGMIDTDILKGQVSDAEIASIRERVVAGIPMGRIGEAGEVAGACLFLASDLSSYMTGAIVDVNGGSHIH